MSTFINDTATIDLINLHAMASDAIQSQIALLLATQQQINNAMQAISGMNLRSSAVPIAAAHKLSTGFANQAEQRAVLARNAAGERLGDIYAFTQRVTSVANGIIAGEGNQG